MPDELLPKLRHICWTSLMASGPRGLLWSLGHKMKVAVIDWSQCPDVERIPGKVSGAWIVRGTRIPVQAVIDNAEDGFTADEIVRDIYPSLAIELARRVIAFAREAHADPHPA